jgi:hypothetical protein
MREIFAVYTDIVEPLMQALTLGFALLLTLILLRFTKLKKLLIAIVIPIVSFFFYIFVAYNIADRYAWGKFAEAVIPHYQQALDRDCGRGNYTADVKGFFLKQHKDSKGGSYVEPRWQTKDRSVQCLINQRQTDWECTCPGRSHYP